MTYEDLSVLVTLILNAAVAIVAGLILGVLRRRLSNWFCFFVLLLPLAIVNAALLIGGHWYQWHILHESMLDAIRSGTVIDSHATPDGVKYHIIMRSGVESRFTLTRFDWSADTAGSPLGLAIVTGAGCIIVRTISYKVLHRNKPLAAFPVVQERPDPPPSAGPP